MPHLASLLRVARRLTLEPSSAEDLVQETMLLAWRGFRTFEPGSNARAWLFRILMNIFHARGRKAMRKPIELPNARATDPRLQEAVEIAEALDTLSVEQRSVFLLSVVEGFTSREVSDILGVPAGTVMSRLSRAREGLRKSLAPLAKEAYK